MSRDIRSEGMDKLCDALLSLKNRDEMYAFLDDLCTVKELDAMGQRFMVAALLKKNETYQEIARETGASTATISRVNRAFTYGNDGYTLALSRIEENK
ncbi:MAG: TrpR YerC/YecD [Lachnospiraceae bacterium]|nr:TrpR YerC/YecD [Lachnospiraceae bacterium]